MISFRVFDSRIRFVTAAALRFYKLTTRYCSLDVAEFNKSHKLESERTDRFQLVATLAFNLAQFPMFDLKTIGKLLIERCLALLECGHVPDEPAGFLNWLGSVQSVVQGCSMSAIESRWFDDDYLGRHEFEYYWLPGDQLVQVMQEAVYTQGMSAVIIKEWLATRPDLMQRLGSNTPSLLLSNASNHHTDVRKTLITRLLDILRAGTFCRCSESPKGHIWQDVVAEVNVVFLNELLDMCQDDGIQLLETDLEKSRELLPRIEPNLDPNIYDELARRLKSAAGDRGSEAA